MTSITYKTAYTIPIMENGKVIHPDDSVAYLSPEHYVLQLDYHLKSDIEPKHST